MTKRMTVTEAVQLTGLSASTIQQASKRGDIRGAQLIGKTWTFTRAALDDWRKRVPQPGRPKQEKKTDEG